jgi:anti-sigma-K factor RskA
MNGSHADMLDDVAVYALGTLPASEAERVRRHLETCAECREEYEALAPAVAAVAQTAEACTDSTNGAVHASPLLKARIMRQVRAPQTTPESRRAFVWPAYLIAAACLLIALSLGWMNLSLTRRLHTAEEPAAPIAHMQAADETTIADLVNEHAKRYIVPGGEIVSSNNRLYIAMHDMAQPPKGKVYQAWTEVKGSNTMMPGATFLPDKHGVAVLPVSSNAKSLHAVAVSVEPPGGSKAPTTSPVVLELLE